MDARTAFAWVLVAVLAVTTWLIIQPFLGWLLFTGLLAFVLLPVHRRLADRVGERPSAGLLTVLVVVLVAIPFGVALNALVGSSLDLTALVAEFRSPDDLERTLERSVGVSIPLGSWLSAASDSLAGFLRNRASGIVQTGFHTVVGILLLLLVLYYLLVDGESLVDWLQQTSPLDAEVNDVLFDSVHDTTWAVLKGHVLVAFVQGFVAGISLFVTGVPRAGLLTVAMMVLAIVPIIGVAPVLAGAILYLFADGQVLAAGFVFVWGFTAVAVTDDYLRAYVIEEESGLHTATVLVGVTGGTYLFGAIGLFVGPIFMGLFKTTVEVLGEHYDVRDDR
ncbi:AI-2E family transporter [Halorubellus sp. JP-L1]|uniref:AI-2E family transporter n=1 Tax=Halorubellus sp. JP-L1 TaxID=2715753 RepID=UPI0014078E82|nr:AI-2E family transporter [Halorubellus sp. JP-L1]NHN40362.1 AI-2E family transporter [Halorubellus sp. JP-L1]